MATLKIKSSNYKKDMSLDMLQDNYINCVNLNIYDAKSTENVVASANINTITLDNENTAIDGKDVSGKFNLPLSSTTLTTKINEDSIGNVYVLKGSFPNMQLSNQTRSIGFISAIFGTVNNTFNLNEPVTSAYIKYTLHGHTWDVKPESITIDDFTNMPSEIISDQTRSGYNTKTAYQFINAHYDNKNISEWVGDSFHKKYSAGNFLLNPWFTDDIKIDDNVPESTKDYKLSIEKNKMNPTGNVACVWTGASSYYYNNGTSENTNTLATPANATALTHNPGPRFNLWYSWFGNTKNETSGYQYNGSPYENQLHYAWPSSFGLFNAYSYEDINIPNKPWVYFDSRIYTTKKYCSITSRLTQVNDRKYEASVYLPARVTQLSCSSNNWVDKTGNVVAKELIDACCFIDHLDYVTLDLVALDYLGQNSDYNYILNDNGTDVIEGTNEHIFTFETNELTKANSTYTNENNETVTWQSWAVPYILQKYKKGRFTASVTVSAKFALENNIQIGTKCYIHNIDGSIVKKNQTDEVTYTYSFVSETFDNMCSIAQTSSTKGPQGLVLTPSEPSATLNSSYNNGASASDTLARFDIFGISKNGKVKTNLGKGTKIEFDETNKLFNIYTGSNIIITHTYVEYDALNYYIVISDSWGALIQANKRQQGEVDYLYGTYVNREQLMSHFTMTAMAQSSTVLYNCMFEVQGIQKVFKNSAFEYQLKLLEADTTNNVKVTFVVPDKLEGNIEYILARERPIFSIKGPVANDNVYASNSLVVNDDGTILEVYVTYVDNSYIIFRTVEDGGSYGVLSEAQVSGLSIDYEHSVIKVYQKQNNMQILYKSISFDDYQFGKNLFTFEFKNAVTGINYKVRVDNHTVDAYTTDKEKIKYFAHQFNGYIENNE